MVPGAHSTVISAAGSTLKRVADGLKYALQLIGSEYRRRAAAQINRIHSRSRTPPSSRATPAEDSMSEQTCCT